MLLYAMHDAVLKAMPGDPMAPCLADSCTMSSDGLSYALSLRKGVKFHNGEELTAEDVKFSLERYRGAASKSLKDRVANVDIHDPHRLTIRLKEPWPDFLTFYAGASGAGWIVPKKYCRAGRRRGFKKAPVGAGPYKFVSFTPGVRTGVRGLRRLLAQEARHQAAVFKVIPDESTRLAALQRNEIDVAYSIRGELADELLRTPGLTIKPALGSAPFWLYFPEQWDPQSPWHDRGAPGGEPGARPQDHERGADARPFAADRQHLPRELRVLLGAAASGLRSARARKLLAEAPCARLRCRRLLLRHVPTPTSARSR